MYFSREVHELAKRFMDCCVKGDTSNGFLETPPVRLEVRSSLEKVHLVLYENE